MERVEIRWARTWIAQNIHPRKKQGEYSSYGLKHLFERDTGMYITNADFKLALYDLGYMPNDDIMEPEETLTSQTVDWWCNYGFNSNSHWGKGLQ